jgi:hypothetical protein
MCGDGIRGQRPSSLGNRAPAPSTYKPYLQSRVPPRRLAISGSLCGVPCGALRHWSLSQAFVAGIGQRDQQLNGSRGAVPDVTAKKEVKVGRFARKDSEKSKGRKEVKGLCSRVEGPPLTP